MTVTDVNIELDNRIAEKVMGWKPVANCVYLAPFFIRGWQIPLYTTNAAGFSLKDIPEHIRPENYSDIQEFHPSTDIRDAWIIVEKFIERDSDDLYNELSVETPLIGQSAESAAMCICRAALRTVK